MAAEKLYDGTHLVGACPTQFCQGYFFIRSVCLEPSPSWRAETSLDPVTYLLTGEAAPELAVWSTVTRVASLPHRSSFQPEGLGNRTMLALHFSTLICLSVHSLPNTHSSHAPPADPGGQMHPQVMPDITVHTKQYGDGNSPASTSELHMSNL